MILITGASGQLGQALTALCQRRGIACRAYSRQQLDICNQARVKACFDLESFDCVINCAAYTAVDAAEDDPQTAFAVNAEGPRILAESGVPVIHLSTDYVFDGKKTAPYGIDAPVNPLSVYGRSKHAGETALLSGCFSGLIVRTAWLYSKKAGSRNSYQTIRQLASKQNNLRVVNDQIGAPTLVDDLAKALVSLYEQKAHLKPMRLLHFTNAGSGSWYDFACAIVRHLDLSCCIEPIATSDYPTKAKRPSYSVLSLDSLQPYAIEPRHWLTALTEDSSHV